MCDLRSLIHIPLAPFVTVEWLDERLQQAPRTKDIRSYFDRKRPSSLSETAKKYLLISGYWHERALRMLRLRHEGEEQYTLDTSVNLACSWMAKAFGCFYQVGNGDDYIYCMGDFESLMTTACLLLSMHTSKAEWAGEYMSNLRIQPLHMLGTTPIRREQGLHEADKALKTFLRLYERRMRIMMGKKGTPSWEEGKEEGKAKDKARSRRPVHVEPSEINLPVGQNNATELLYHSGTIPQTIWQNPTTPAPTCNMVTAMPPSPTLFPIYDPASTTCSPMPPLPVFKELPNFHEESRQTSNRGCKRPLKTDDQCYEQPSQRRKGSISVATSTPDLPQPISPNGFIQQYFEDIEWDPNVVDLTPLDGFCETDIIRYNYTLLL